MQIDNQTIVSIFCSTYNQENYIGSAIESFLLQKTNFSIEIIIHDDASTDGTAKIVREYSKKYPDLIVPILQTENQFSQGVKIWPTYLFSSTRGKYIALCEGDDYWTDPLKLQKQVDFLSSHPEHSICFHPVRVIDEIGMKPHYINPPESDQNNFNFSSLLKGNIIPTSSVLYRRDPDFVFPSWFWQIKLGDWPLNLLMASHGKIGFLNEVMSVYRIHEGSYWSSRPRSEAIVSIIEMYHHLDNHFLGRFHRQIKENIGSFQCTLGNKYLEEGQWQKAIYTALKSLFACRSKSFITWKNRCFLLIKSLIHRNTKIN
jgi:glycosyltransferase involved in cell wall biosynthesis